MTAPVVPAHKVKRLGANFQTVYHICCRVTCLVLVGFNSAILDYYLIEYRKSPGPACYMWIVADILVVCLFVVALTSSYKYYKLRRLPSKLTGLRRLISDLPLSYVSWLAFSAVMSAKICVIYVLPNSIANQLKEENFFGPNTLKTGICLAAIILYLFVLSHHDYKTNSKQNSFIQGMVGSAYLDLLDTTQFLGAFGEDADVIVRNDVDKIVLAIVCLNYVLPTATLYFLARSRFGICPPSSKFQLVHKVVCFLIINVPMFAIRMVIWHMHEKNISVFVVKNIIAIGMSFKEVHEFCLEVSDVVHEKEEEEEVVGCELDVVKSQESVAIDQSQANCLYLDEESRRLSMEPVATPSSKNSAI